MQLHLLSAPVRSSALTLARAERDRARRRVVEVWGRGVTLRALPDGRVQLRRGRVILVTRRRYAGPNPGALDAPAWLRREARAWWVCAHRPGTCRGCGVRCVASFCPACRRAIAAAERAQAAQDRDDAAFLRAAQQPLFV